MSEALARYELVVLVRQDVSTSHVESLQDEFKSPVEGAGGRVDHIEYCGLLSLAYPVARNNRAHFLIFDIESKPDALVDLERKLRMSEDVIRFLRVRVEAFGKKPSVLAQSHVNREQFGRAQFRHDRAGSSEKPASLSRDGGAAQG